MKLFFVGAHALCASTGVPLKVAFFTELLSLGMAWFAMRDNGCPLKVAMLKAIIAWIGITATMLASSYIVELVRAYG